MFCGVKPECDRATEFLAPTQNCDIDTACEAGLLNVKDSSFTFLDPALTDSLVWVDGFGCVEIESWTIVVADEVGDVDTELGVEVDNVIGDEGSGRPGWAKTIPQPNIVLIFARAVMPA